MKQQEGEDMAAVNHRWYLHKQSFMDREAGRTHIIWKSIFLFFPWVEFLHIWCYITKNHETIQKNERGYFFLLNR
jgi:hypothetical protein